MSLPAATTYVDPEMKITHDHRLKLKQWRTNHFEKFIPDDEEILSVCCNTSGWSAASKWCLLLPPIFYVPVLMKTLHPVLGIKLKYLKTFLFTYITTNVAVWKYTQWKNHQFCLDRIQQSHSPFAYAARAIFAGKEPSDELIFNRPPPAL